MYLWIALDLGDALDRLRERALFLNRHLGLSEAAFTLPAHISLKISFSLPDEAAERAKNRILRLLQNRPAFSVKPTGLEASGKILWVKFKESEPLSELHQLLDEVLLAEFSVERHPFDLAFAYHSTLFLDGDADTLSTLSAALQSEALPREILPCGFLIGSSESGKAGTYRVDCRIPFSN